MLKFICLFLCAVAVIKTGVYACENVGPTSIKELDMILLECADEHGVIDAELQTAMEVKDQTLVDSCFWACCFKKSGFLNDQGQYVLYPGLTFVRNIVKRDDLYTNIENVARRCKSVKDVFVSDAEAACGRGALIASCFLEHIDQIRIKKQFVTKTYNYYVDYNMEAL